MFGRSYRPRLFGPIRVGHDMRSASVLTPRPFTTEAFSDATAAVDRLDEIYDRNTRFLRDRFEAYINGEPLRTRVRRHLSVCARYNLDPCAARFTAPDGFSTGNSPSGAAITRYPSEQNFVIGSARLKEPDNQMADDPYHEFEEALRDVLCEEEFNLTRRRRLVRARERINQHDPRYVEAVKRVRPTDPSSLRTLER